MVLLLLVQHVLLLGLLQGSFVNLPPVHLLQLLTLLKGKAARTGGLQPGAPRPPRMQRRRQTRTCPPRSCGQKEPRERTGVLREQLTHVCGYSCTRYIHLPCWVSERKRPRGARVWERASGVQSVYEAHVAWSLVIREAGRTVALHTSLEVHFLPLGAPLPPHRRVCWAVTALGRFQQRPVPRSQEQNAKLA